MIINKPSFELQLSKAENRIYNISDDVAIYDISGNEITEVFRFTSLKYPNHLAISSDEKMLAYSNTSGHIAVHDLKSGELLLKSKCISKEGGNIFFTDKNRKIIASEWGGEVFTLDIKSGEVEIVYQSEHNIDNIFQLDNESESIIIDGEYPLCISKISLVNNDAQLCNSITYKHCAFEAFNYSKNNDKYYFCGEEYIKKKRRILKRYNTKKIIYKLTYKNNISVDILLDLNDIVSLDTTIIDNFYSIRDICVSKDEKYMLLCLDDLLFGFDLQNMIFLGSKKLKNITSITFVSSETKVMLGTMSNILTIDSSILFSKNEYLEPRLNLFRDKPDITKLDKNNYINLEGEIGLVVNTYKFITTHDNRILIFNVDNLSEYSHIVVDGSINKLALTDNKESIIYCTDDSVGMIDIKTWELIISNKVELDTVYCNENSQIFDNYYISEVFPTSNNNVVLIVINTDETNFFTFFDIRCGDTECVWSDGEFEYDVVYNFYTSSEGLYYSHTLKEHERNGCDSLIINKMVLQSKKMDIKLKMSDISLNLFNEDGDNFVESLVITSNIEMAVSHKVSSLSSGLEHSYAFYDTEKKVVLIEIVDTSARGRMVRSVYNSVMNQLVIIYEKSITIFALKRGEVSIKGSIEISNIKDCIFLEKRNNMIFLY